jgi:cytidine deaminase
MSKNSEKLIEAAKKVRKRAFAPYSNFKVGAAVITTGGQVFTGCNVESASFGLTVCAERVAIWKAVSEGESEFEEIVVVVDTEKLTPPCGACRQIIWEFCGDVPVTMANLNGDTETISSKELLPIAFDSEFFK